MSLIECEHEYAIEEVEGGIVYFRCTLCGQLFTSSVERVFKNETGED